MSGVKAAVFLEYQRPCDVDLASEQGAVAAGRCQPLQMNMLACNLNMNFDCHTQSLPLNVHHNKDSGWHRVGPIVQVSEMAYASQRSADLPVAPVASPLHSFLPSAQLA